MPTTVAQALARQQQAQAAEQQNAALAQAVTGPELLGADVTFGRRFPVSGPQSIQSPQLIPAQPDSAPQIAGGVVAPQPGVGDAIAGLGQALASPAIKAGLKSLIGGGSAAGASYAGGAGGLTAAAQTLSGGNAALASGAGFGAGPGAAGAGLVGAGAPMTLAGAATLAAPLAGAALGAHLSRLKDKNPRNFTYGAGDDGYGLLHNQRIPKGSPYESVQTAFGEHVNDILRAADVDPDDMVGRIGVDNGRIRVTLPNKEGNYPSKPTAVYDDLTQAMGHILRANGAGNVRLDEFQPMDFFAVQQKAANDALAALEPFVGGSDSDFARDFEQRRMLETARDYALIGDPYAI